jgi:serine/threonine-protein kinase
MVESEEGIDEPVTGDLPTAGTVLAGKYVVEHVIGSGGMGCVVAARHRDLGQAVAMKFLRADVLGEKAAVERFLREARAVVSIKSEHVAKVSDVGKLENGAPYMVMEHLVGKDLAAVLAGGGKIAMADAIDYVVQAAEAIAEAHSHGVVHRDLKPANLFLARRADGSALIKVLDFGIAKALAKNPADHSLTATGSALGTPMYMSPEQVRDAKTVDPRTDIWGLGTTLYELLAGEPPFEADTLPALCAAIVSDPPPPLRQMRPEVPAALEAIVNRCLEKLPANRYQTVAELARDIAPYAPLRCEMLLERIVRILDGPEATVGWSRRDSLSETLVSGTEPVASRRSPPPIETADTDPPPKPAPRRAFGDTAAPTSWDNATSRPVRRTRLYVGAAAAVALAVVAAVWLGDSDPPAVTPVATDAPVADKPTAAPSVPTATATAPPTAEAMVAPTATASASAEPAATAKSRPPPKRTTGTGGGKKPPPPPPTGGSDLDVISDRK